MREYTVHRYDWLPPLVIGMLTMPLASVSAQDTERLPERGEIATKYLWATENIFPNVEAWEKEFETVEKMVEELPKLKGTLGKSADHLLRALKTRDDVEPRLSRVYVYTSLLSDQDTRVGENQALKSRARSLMIKYGRLTSWMEPELTAIPFETIESWMREDPKLGLYRQAFDNLFRQKKYVLSPREEELLAMMGEVRSTPGNAYNLLANADIEFPSITDEDGKKRELDDSAFYMFMRSSDRRVRRDAYNAIVGTYAKYRNTAAALLNGAVQNHILTVRARGYDSCRAAALDGSNIPVEVYDALVRTVNENLYLLHRYQELRKRVLNLEDGVHAYDLFAPFVSEADLEYTYEDGVSTILTALEPLGPAYVSQMKKGFDSRWVDVFPTRGKRSGAYSSGTFLTQPYILLNFHGTFDSVSTLAHEMGHSMHSFYSRGTQPYVYADYDIFCAEVASTLNEILLQDYVLKQTPDTRTKLYLIGEFLEAVRGTVFRQTMFSEFEQRIHEMAEAGKPLTADSMSAAYGEIMRRYYGSSYTHDDLVDSYWIRIPHFYYNFYVYKYATSFSAATSIAKRLNVQEPGAREAYLLFLRAGSSKYPIDVLKAAGVDMTTAKPFQDAMKLFETLLANAEKLLRELDMIS
jgi:oligoendopeptidase F